MVETKPLEEFIIVVDGKPFIKCKNPTVRVDFKWKKFKPTEIKMGDITIVEQIALAIEAMAEGYSEQQLCDVINAIINNPEVAQEMAHEIYIIPGVSPKQLRAIIRGYSSQIA